MRSRLSNLMLFCGAPVWAGALAPHAAVDTQETKPQRYPARGTVRSHREGSSLAVIVHEEIHGCLEAMTAPLTARKKEELQGIKAGDTITFRLNVREDDCWIDRIRICGPSRKPDK